MLAKFLSDTGTSRSPRQGLLAFRSFTQASSVTGLWESLRAHSFQHLPWMCHLLHVIRPELWKGGVSLITFPLKILWYLPLQSQSIFRLVFRTISPNGFCLSGFSFPPFFCFLGRGSSSSLFISVFFWFTIKAGRLAIKQFWRGMTPVVGVLINQPGYISWLRNLGRFLTARHRLIHVNQFASPAGGHFWC